MARPDTSDYPEYFGRYINLVPQDDLLSALKDQQQQIEQLLHSVDEETSAVAYAPGKWTLKELLQHIIDAERIFGYRALAIARKETVSLPSFDENLYAQNSRANIRTWKSLGDEFINLRISTLDLFGSLTEAMLRQKGLANNNSISVLSLGFITVGHVIHHVNIVNDRYLSKKPQ